MHKANIMKALTGIFLETAERLYEAKYKDRIAMDSVIIDACAMKLVLNPWQFDVLVTTNLFGDILSDVAAEGMGGLPLAPSAGIGEGWAYFESCHGSAPDLAGQDVANPAATILSAAMMLTYLGLADASRRLTTATVEAIASGVRTRDMGGSAGTTAFAAEVCRRL